MKTFLLRLFTWWNSQTFGTQLWTWLYGEFVGEDEFGSRYYRTRNGKIDPALGFDRRWVIYKGLAEASLIPPSWHGWLHHIVDTPPTLEAAKSYRWEKPHEPNLTGTPAARRPSGSTGQQDDWYASPPTAISATVAASTARRPRLCSSGSSCGPTSRAAPLPR